MTGGDTANAKIIAVHEPEDSRITGRGNDKGLAAACADDPQRLLTDGDICSSSASEAYVWHGDSAQLIWDAPVTADMLLLWPAGSASVAGTSDSEGGSRSAASSLMTAP